MNGYDWARVPNAADGRYDEAMWETNESAGRSYDEALWETNDYVQDNRHDSEEHVRYNGHDFFFIQD